MSRPMREVFRSNDLVKLSYAQALLADRNIEAVVLDDHAAGVYGGALMSRRIMVPDEDTQAALRVIDELRD